MRITGIKNIGLMECPNCNQEINEEIRFCGYCGTKIENMNSL